MAMKMDNYEDIIELDIWSSFGCFTKPFSNTGGFLSYLIPPKTSIIGMIAAILGYEFDSYIELDDGSKKFKIEGLYDIKVSIQALFDLKVKRVTFNSHYGNEPHLMNIHQDILINPYYRIYLSFPVNLKNEKKEFLKKLHANETVYNLYMGRNEFFMNYKFMTNIINPKTKVLTAENSNNFFEDSEEQKIYGTIDKRIIGDVTLSEISEGVIFGRITPSLKKLKSFYEYIIRDYPIGRYNFTDFKYAPISFYTMNKNEDCFFSKLNLNKNKELKLCEIGENKWISLI